MLADFLMKKDQGSPTGFDIIKKIGLRFFENTGFTPFTRTTASHTIMWKGI
jgi:hypothetical protein